MQNNRDYLRNDAKVEERTSPCLLLYHLFTKLQRGKKLSHSFETRKAELKIRFICHQSFHEYLSLYPIVVFSYVVMHLHSSDSPHKPNELAKHASLFITSSFASLMALTK
jgi:hypothetical protein